jgi:hypothetical protein
MLQYPRGTVVVAVVLAEAVAGDAVRLIAAPPPTARPTDRTAAVARGVADLVGLRCFARVRPDRRRLSSLV